MRKMTMLVVAIATALIATHADAKHRSHHATQPQATVTCNHLGCSDRHQAAAPVEPIIVRGETITVSRGRVVGHRPAGCPHRFCGCALALRIFHKLVPRLNLAKNWLSFRHVAPAPRMVAARSGHVFMLLEHVSGKKWKVWDPNSGHGAIRVHERSIAGYTIVDPYRSAYAMAE